jgi:hypothetical protein
MQVPVVRVGIGVGSATRPAQLTAILSTLQSRMCDGHEI